MIEQAVPHDTEFRMLVPWELQTRIHAERFAKIAMKVFEKYA
jgi:hypothetical protein